MAANGSNITSVAANAAAVQLVASNVQRRADATGPSAVINNNGTTVLYVMLGDGVKDGEVTTAKYTYQVPVNGNLEVWGYRGPMRGIWAGAPTGNAVITELL